MTNEWAYSLDGETYTGDCKSRAEAIAEAICEADDRDDEDRPTSVWTAKSVAPAIGLSMSPDDVLETLANRAADDTIGTDIGDDWPGSHHRTSKSYEALAVIVEKFNEAVDAWVAEHDPPNWWGVDGAEEHPVPPRSAPTAE